MQGCYTEPSYIKTSARALTPLVEVSRRWTTPIVPARHANQYGGWLHASFPPWFKSALSAFEFFQGNHGKNHAVKKIVNFNPKIRRDGLCSGRSDTGGSAQSRQGGPRNIDRANWKQLTTKTGREDGRLTTEPSRSWTERARPPMGTSQSTSVAAPRLLRENTGLSSSSEPLNQR
jgi:hypothetical protein